MEYLILVTIGFIAALTPGPDIFYILRQTLCKGVKRGFLALYGILIGNIIYLTLVGFGIGVVGKSPYFQAIVGLFGGVYLLKIAYLSYIDKPHLQKECQELNSFSLIKEALFLNLSNPKAMIFFAVVVAPFITKSIFLSLSSLFIGITSAFISTVIFSSKLSINDQTLILINKIASVVFVFFSLLLFRSAFQSFKDIFNDTLMP